MTACSKLILTKMTLTTLTTLNFLVADVHHLLALGEQMLHVVLEPVTKDGIAQIELRHVLGEEHVAHRVDGLDARREDVLGSCNGELKRGGQSGQGHFGQNQKKKKMFLFCSIVENCTW